MEALISDPWRSLLLQFGGVTVAAMALAEFLPIPWPPAWCDKAWHPRRVSAAAWALVASFAGWAIGLITIPAMIPALGGNPFAEFAVVAVLALINVAIAHGLHRAKRAAVGPGSTESKP